MVGGAFLLLAALLWRRTHETGATVASVDELIRIPAPQPHVGKPHPFSQTTLFSIVAPSLISNMIPARVFAWTRLPLAVKSRQSISHQIPTPSLSKTSLSIT